MTSNDHDVLTMTTDTTAGFNNDLTLQHSVTCRCGAVFHGATAEEAQERHRHHFRHPEARAGIAAARKALEEGRNG